MDSDIKFKIIEEANTPVDIQAALSDLVEIVSSALKQDHQKPEKVSDTKVTTHR